MKNLVIDVDDTISFSQAGKYSEAVPNLALIEKIKYYRGLGFKITLFSSRNMRTYNGNVGLINIHTLPVMTEWLEKHNVPYDEILVGKPWCGHEGFYVDDKAVRPDEFVNLSYEELRALTSKPNDSD